jgi:2-dehydropantoate 2-reductase
MKTAIIGGGALGLLWGARLARAGFPVTMIVRTQSQAATIKKMGMTVQSLSGGEWTVSTEACASSSLPSGKADSVFVMVKQMDLPAVTPLIASLAHEETQVLFWQNGWGHGEIVKKLSAQTCTYLAVTTEGALRLGENRVAHTGNGETWVGPYPSSRKEPHPALERLWQLEQKMAWDPDILVRIWEKLAVNCVINPLTALEDVPNGEVGHPRFEQMKRAIIEETVRVARAEGIRLDTAAVKERVERVIRLTARNHSSMLQDMKRGRKTEIAHINGAVAELGAKWGIPTPVNAELVRRVQDKEAQIGC